MNAASPAQAIAPGRLRRSNRDRIMVTPEGIALPLTLASRGTRLGALMLDLIFIGLLMSATTVALLAIAGGTATLEAAESKGGNAGRALEGPSSSKGTCHLGSPRSLLHQSIEANIGTGVSLCSCASGA